VRRIPKKGVEEAPGAHEEEEERITLQEADIVMILIPDAHGVEQVRNIVAALEGSGTSGTVVMFNPSVVSSEVGVGLLSRRLARELNEEWETAYCLRPTERGAVFRRYPEDWKVFIDDEDRPGRYALLGSQMQRPTSDRIEEWLYERYADEQEDAGIVGSIGLAVREFNRFMRSLSN